MLGVKILLAAAVAVAMIPGQAGAQFAGSNLPGPKHTVVQLRDARVGDRVTVTGFIKNEIRRAQYLFQDETGEIRVRIEKEIWRGRKVTTKTRIKLGGRVQSDVRGRFIDAYYFQIID
ncbi:MAG: NirD/YgiW/YdeI family stress tolerance protein [Rhizobiaceae bacterium]|nr:NirD/YgiW/YdeI family stress tolerance protein [Rhizobiaceae bacterium]